MQCHYYYFLKWLFFFFFNLWNNRKTLSRTSAAEMVEELTVKCIIVCTDSHALKWQVTSHANTAMKQLWFKHWLFPWTQRLWSDQKQRKSCSQYWGPSKLVVEHSSKVSKPSNQWRQMTIYTALTARLCSKESLCGSTCPRAGFHKNAAQQSQAKVGSKTLYLCTASTRRCW